MSYEIIVFVARGCPHCHQLMNSEHFRRFLRAQLPRVRIVDTSTDIGINSAALYLGITAEERQSWLPGQARVVRTPAIVVRRGATVRVLQPQTPTAEDVWIQLSGLLGEIGVEPPPLPLTVPKKKEEKAGERRERRRKK